MTQPAGENVKLRTAGMPQIRAIFTAFGRATADSSVLGVNGAAAFPRSRPLGLVYHRAPHRWALRANLADLLRNANAKRGGDALWPSNDDYSITPFRVRAH